MPRMPRMPWMRSRVRPWMPLWRRLRMRRMRMGFGWLLPVLGRLPCMVLTLIQCMIDGSDVAGLTLFGPANF
jgi:hypothetical protein